MPTCMHTYTHNVHAHNKIFNQPLVVETPSSHSQRINPLLIALHVSIVAAIDQVKATHQAAHKAYSLCQASL